MGAVTPKSSDPASTLAGDDLASWKGSVLAVSDLGFSEEEAAHFIAQAFGWRGQGYWRRSRVDEVPVPEEVKERLGFLSDLGIDDAAVIVSGFPEVLALEIGDLKANADVLEDKWFMKGKVRANALKRRPEVLGYNIDCEGDCAGECNRCWVRF